jgi:integrase
MGLELQEITCRERHAEVAKNCGKYAANSAMRALRTIGNTARVEDKQLRESPTIVLRSHWFEEERVQSPVEDLPAWAARVAELDNPTRRHLYWTILLTGMRSHDARTVRWEDINFKEGTLFRPKPKGSKKKAFTISLSQATLVLLRLQRRHVRMAHPRSPWVFPTIGNDSKITHVKDALIRDKTKKVNGKKVVVREGLPSVHRLRDTFASIATEAGIGYFDLQVLLNHSLPKGVTGGYVKQSNPHTAHVRRK